MADEQKDDLSEVSIVLPTEEEDGKFSSTVSKELSVNSLLLISTVKLVVVHPRII